MQNGAINVFMKIIKAIKNKVNFCYGRTDANCQADNGEFKINSKFFVTF